MPSNAGRNQTGKRAINSADMWVLVSCFERFLILKRLLDVCL